MVRSRTLSLVGCSCGYTSRAKIAAFDLEPEDDLAMHIAAALGTRTLLLDSVITVEEREIEAMEPRRGAGLTQESTDFLIVKELREAYLNPSEYIEFDGLVSAFTTRLKALTIPLVGPLTMGGIHSDPFVRVIAFRAWGRRDLDWGPSIAKPTGRSNIQSPPMQNIPARKPSGKSTPSQRTRFIHDRHCTDEDCDGQCFYRG